MQKFNLLSLLIFIVTVSVVHAQKLPGLDPSPADIAIFRPNGNGTDPVAKVIYGRPQKKGRTMLGGTEPFGKVWRTGANETTEIRLYKDVTFGDKKLPAGTYSLYSIPNKTEWTIIFNSKLNTWGAFAYDESKDVARIKVASEKSSDEIEAFTIAFDGPPNASYMILAWENTLIRVPLKF